MPPGSRLPPDATALLRVPDTLPGSFIAWKELAVTALGVTLGLGPSPDDDRSDTISVPPLPRFRDPDPGTKFTNRSAQ